MKNIIDKHFAIKEVKLNRNVLTVHAVMPIRSFIREKKSLLNTQMLINLLKSEYEIIQVLEESKISNWEKSGYTREGIWKFKVKTQKKEKQSNKKENIGLSTSFRGRISKIAKQEQETND